MTDHRGMRLGKKAPKLDHRMLKLGNYLPSDLPPAPPSCTWSARISQLGMLLNDQLGDCTCAGAAHMEQAWTANVGQEFVPSDQDVLASYEQLCGYVQGDPSTDNGGILVDVLNGWRKVGIAGRKIEAYVALETHNPEHVKQAVNLFGGAYIGLALPLSAQLQDVWHLAPSGASGNPKPGSWGGHCVCVLDYDATGLTCITWGQRKLMTWPFWFAYTDEAFACLSPDWAPSGRLSPSGFDFAALEADLIKVTG